MSATSEQPGQQPQTQSAQRVRRYMLDGEEISYSLRVRPTGLINWLKSLLGYGVTHWYVTDQRLIEETRISGGFVFRDAPHGKISSIEYGAKVSIPTVAFGLLLTLAGVGLLVEAGNVGVVPIVLGLLLVGYAYWRRQQVLAVHASGGVQFALNISKGQQVDELLWYLHAERDKYTGSA